MVDCSSRANMFEDIAWGFAKVTMQLLSAQMKFPSLLFQSLLEMHQDLRTLFSLVFLDPLLLAEEAHLFLLRVLSIYPSSEERTPLTVRCRHKGLRACKQL